MSQKDGQNALQEAQQKKIDFFCLHINNNDISKAEYYLTKANWDEKLAVQIYFNNNDIVNKNGHNNQQGLQLKRHTSARANVKKINQYIDDNVEKNKFNYPKAYNSNYIEYNITCLIEKENNKGINSLHLKNILYIKNNLKNVETNFNIFFQKLKYNSGVILLFDDESYSKVKGQINNINISIKNINQNYVIFPTTISTTQGICLRGSLSCISFPSYIFCRYKDEQHIYITDRMDGAFDITFFKESILKNIQSINQNKIDNKENKKKDMKVIPLPQKNNNEKKDEKVMNDVLNYFNRGKSNKDHHHQNNNNIIQNKENLNKKQNHNIPNPYKKDNNIIKKQIIDNNNIKINNNKEINNNLNNNNSQKKVFDAKDYGDFFLGDSIEIPFLFGNYQNNSIKQNNYNFNEKEDNFDYLQDFRDNNKININNKLNNNENNKQINQNNIIKNDSIIRDSIYNLSDGQVLAKREEEMRKLERMQEEKERKEEEERKEEQRKKLEEEKKIKKYEKEAEIAKMILDKEPDDTNPDVCFIKFRLPDGEKMLERRFLKNDKISILYDYIKSIGREIFIEPDATDFDIFSSDFPPQNLENKKNSTLEKEGLYPNSILQIREK